MTAIVIAEAACKTLAGTRCSRAAPYCHSVGAADDGRGRESRVDELAAEDRLRAVADAP